MNDKVVIVAKTNNLLKVRSEMFAGLLPKNYNQALLSAKSIIIIEGIN